MKLMSFIQRRGHILKVTSYHILKRLFDIISSLMGLLILLPIFIFISILIKIDDPKGSVLFKQERVGKGEKVFYIFKFRTMVINAEDMIEELLPSNEMLGAMFKMKEDPRVTKIGRFLRRTSLDEFPQLINVLIGDMSLIGPRPPLVREVSEYTEYSKKRLEIKPGCTGLWQVSGRNKIGFDEMVELDLEYINNLNIISDMKIFFKTFKVLFGQEGY